MLGREARTFRKPIAEKVVVKWQESYSQVCGFVDARVSIAIL